MAVKLSNTSGTVATISTLDPGDIGINLSDGKMFVTNGNTVFEIGANISGNSFVGGNVTVNGNISGSNIFSTGDVTAFFSDDRLKQRKNNIENALDKVDSLNGFYYVPNKLAQELGYEPTLQVGVSAQEVQKILPEVVVPAPIDEQYLTVKYEKLVPLLIEAIKELKEKLNRIENRSE